MPANTSPTQLASTKSAASVDSLTFTWSAPFQDPTIIEYTFKYGTRSQDVEAGTGSTIFKQVGVDGGTSASVTLDNLGQGVDYFAQVAVSQTSEGPVAGLFSSMAEATTMRECCSDFAVCSHTWCRHDHPPPSVSPDRHPAVAQLRGHFRLVVH